MKPIAKLILPGHNDLSSGQTQEGIPHVPLLRRWAS